MIFSKSLRQIILSSVENKSSGGILFVGPRGTLKLFSTELIISNFLKDYADYLPFNHPDIYCYGVYDYRLYYDFLVKMYDGVCNTPFKDFFVRFLSFCLAVRKPESNGNTNISSLIYDLLKVSSGDCNSELVKSILERFETFISKLSKIESIGIDVVRDVVDFCNKTSLSGYKFVVMPNFEFATIEAQNAFLKTLEEPPKNTFILLTTSKYSSVLPTISSRAFKVSFLKLKGSEVLEVLGNIKKLGVSEDNYYTLFDLMVDYIYDVYGKFLEEFIEVFVSSDLEKVMIFAEKVSQDEILVEKFFEIASFVLNALLEVRSKIAGVDVSLNKFILNKIPNRVFSIFTISSLYKLQKLLNDSYTKIYTYNFNPKFVITNFFVEVFS